jgi:hypothetical protein
MTNVCGIPCSPLYIVAGSLKSDLFFLNWQFSLFLRPKLIIFTHLIHDLLSYEYYNNTSGNTVPRKCRTDTDRKKVAFVASLNQLVQHEKKKS